MNDCPNAEMRDRLPDLLHDRLDAAGRMEVEAHVAGCVDCQAELTLLRDLRGAMAHGVRVDIARIAAALPGSGVGVVRARRAWVDWRIAAAVTLLLAGGTSVASIMGGENPALPGVSTATVASGAEGGASEVRIEPKAGGSEVTTPAPVRVATASEVYVAGGLADMSASELESLLQEIETLDALPITEPEVQTVPLSSREEET